VLAKISLHGENADPKRLHRRNGIGVNAKADLVKTFQKRILNPTVGALVRRGVLSDWALLETKGRKTGLQRTTPVGYRLVGDTVWLVAEFGRGASYVRNLEADPGVRVCIRGVWRAGTAHVLADDDARARLRTLPRLNSAAVRIVGTDLLTIRIDLEG
jgi:deazaflavin-dependent oxidoreductase (nitroreductase family)